MLPLIVGIGLQTPLGTTLGANWRALIGGRFIVDHARVPAQPRPGSTRLTVIATAVAMESIADAGIDSLDGADTALVVGTSKGPVEQWLTPELRTGHAALVGSALRAGLSSSGGSVRSELENTSFGGLPCEAWTAPSFGTIPAVHAPQAGPLNALNPNLRADPDETAPGDPVPAGLADLAGQIARTLGIAGPRLTLSAACASGLHALIRATLLIRSGEAQRVLVVAAESSLHPLFIGSFQRLGVLPPPGFGCRPFNRDRRGFVMSEAAAAVVLETPGLAARRASRRPVAVERFAFAGDATHITSNDPQAKALRHILAAVSDGRPFDMVHAHGTGTEANDAAELAALEATLPPSRSLPTLYSHKGALGHSLGASGLVSVVLNCMSHQSGIIPGNVQTPQPLASAAVEIRQQPTERKVERSLAIAAGFGGAMAAVSLRSLAMRSGGILTRPEWSRPLAQRK